MTNIKLYVTRTEICVTVDGKLTSGMVGVPCTLEYGPEWEGLHKTAVFTAGCVSRDVVNAEGTVEVPAECLELPDVRLSVGVYGFNADEVVVIPTVMAPVGHIFPGADPSGDPGTDPELPIWANHEARIKKIEEEGDGGGGSGKPGADGGYYTPTVSQPDANHATFTFEPSKEGMAEVPQQTVTLPAGPKGEPGERGPQGEAGPAGADGKDGVIALTGAKVGDIARVAAVDENGVPTAWEPVDMPSGGETWDELANVTLEEEAWPVIDIGDYAVNFKKLRFFIVLAAMTPASVAFALSIPNATTGMGYNICTINSFGNESGISNALIEFEPLIEEGFCRASYSWATPPTTAPKASNFLYQYNSYDYRRLKTARYFRPNMQLPAGTMIVIKGVRA